MNATDRLNLQELKAKASQAKLLVSQARMQARGAAAVSTGPVGAVKGAGLTAAAGGCAAVNAQLVTQLQHVETQKAIQQSIADKQAQMATKTPQEVPALRAQLATLQKQLQATQKLAYASRTAARTALPAILKILKAVSF